MTDTLPPPQDPLRLLLQRQWQAPAASPDALTRLLECPRPEARGGPDVHRARFGWGVAGVAIAAGAALLLTVSTPPAKRVQQPATPQLTLSDEDVLGSMFATYEVEENL